MLRASSTATYRFGSGGTRHTDLRPVVILFAAWAIAVPWTFAQERSSQEQAPAAAEKPAAPAPQASVAPAAPVAEPPVRSSRGIEEIVVTARKTEENIQDVPIPITALQAEDLERTSTFEMRDLGLRVPNMLTAIGPAQPTALVFQMRGQIQVDILGTLDPSIGFYDDGVYVARPHGSNASFVDVESVQVLRGPQGTLFGRNTTGGAVLLSTNDPDFEGISGSVGAILGSFERRAFRGVLNLPLLTDTLAFRVAGETLSTDGFAFDETNDRDIATEVHDLLRAKLLYRPFDGLTFLLAGQYIDLDQLGFPLDAVFALKPQQVQQPGTCCLAYLNSVAQGVNYDGFVGGDPDRSNFDPGLEPRSKIKVRSGTLTATWDQPWATIKFIGGARQNADAGNRIDIDGSPSKIVDTLQANENLQQSYELQLTGSWFGDRLDWAGGAIYFDESGEELGTTFAFIPLLAPINPILTPGDIDNRAIAGYAQATYALTPKLRVTGGVRHTRDRKRLVLRATMGDLCAVPEELRDDAATCKGTFDDSFNNTSFIAGTDYRLFENASWIDDMLVYFSVTTGYRAGGQNLRGTSADTLTPFKPETLMQVEGGFKSELFDRRVRLNLTGFYTFYEDIQRSIIIASNSVLPATVTTNAASADIPGAELELTALPPIEGVQLGASFGLVLPKYNEFRDVTGDRTNEKFQAVPEKTYSLSVAYASEVFGMPWLNALDWSWTDEIPFQPGELRYFRGQGFDLEPLVNQPALGKLSARSALTFANGVEVGLWGRNLTDERTFATLVLGGGPDFVTRLATNPGRELGGDVTVRF